MCCKNISLILDHFIQSLNNGIQISINFCNFNFFLSRCYQFHGRNSTSHFVIDFTFTFTSVCSEFVRWGRNFWDTENSLQTGNFFLLLYTDKFWISIEKISKSRKSNFILDWLIDLFDMPWWIFGWIGWTEIDGIDPQDDVRCK